MAAAVLSPHDIQTTLNYYAPLGDPTAEPYHYVYLTPPPGTSEHNLGDDERPVVVHDARGRESEFSLDTTDFQFVRHVSARTGGTSYLERVHIDQTYEATIKRVHQLLGDEANRLLRTRVRLINVWRPIGHPVYHRPLAWSEWRNLDECADLVPMRYLYPNRTGATFSVRYNPAHRWWYLSQQTSDEVTLIKCYDPETDRARLTPHSAFWDQTSPRDALHRQSIELRALLFDE